MSARSFLASARHHESWKSRWTRCPPPPRVEGGRHQRACRTATILPAASPVDTRARTSTAGTDGLDPRCADEDAVHGAVDPLHLEVTLEGVDLAAEGVAANGDVEAAEGLLTDLAVEERARPA